MNLLITGATGFIGRSLLTGLKNKYQFCALVRESSDTSFLEENNIPYFIFNENYEELQKLFEEKKFSGVLHLATLFIKDHQTKDLKNLLESNILLGTQILDMAVNNKVPWFVNTGTFWQHFENEPYNPANLYASTKEAFEKIATYYWKSSDLNFMTLKINDTFGPGDTRRKLINVLIETLAKSGHMKMSKGEQIMDICYIKDVIRAFDHLIQLAEENKVPPGACFALSSQKRMSLKDLVGEFEEVCQKKLNISWDLPYRQREVMLPWDQGIPLPSFESQYSFKKGIEETLSASNFLSR
jgi:CDP-paratose synthetase